MSLTSLVDQILQMHESRDKATDAWNQYTEEKKYIRNYSDLIQEKLSSLYEAQNNDYTEYLRKAILIINRDPLMSLPDLWEVRKIFQTEIEARESGGKKISAIYKAIGISLPGINDTITAHTQEKTADILSIWEEKAWDDTEEELWGVADAREGKRPPKIINVNALYNDDSWDDE